MPPGLLSPRGEWRLPVWNTPRRAFPTAVRARILKRDPICRACGVRPSTIADHIVPVAEGGTDDETNGQGLCSPCHDPKSAAERARGLQRWNERRPRQRRDPEPHPGVIG
ncbi:HNH endonuclease signature motif containing protein [Saccharomonospora sp. NPDC046836]|uniref:HNH endonuclease n=1 Tax=Saccharomonospora sp. NPDC046836 TaxID=3156921 RepID=UPI0033EEFE6D